MSETNDKKRWSVSDTAKSEIRLNEEIERTYDQLDEEWRMEREKMANMAAPSPSLGPASERSIQAEYQIRRSKHDRKREATGNFFNKTRETIEDNGRTLGEDFQSAVDPSVEPETSDSLDDLSTEFDNAANVEVGKQEIVVERTITRTQTYSRGN